MTASTDVRFCFRGDLAVDRRPDGICLYLPGEGRGLVARGLTGDLVAHLRDTVGNEPFGIESLHGIADGVDHVTWWRLLKELCSRGAIIRRDPDDPPEARRELVTPAIGIVGDAAFAALLHRELCPDGPSASVDVAAGDAEPRRHLGTTWQHVSLVVSFDAQPSATRTRAWNREVVATGRTFLPVRTAGYTAEIGPLAVPGESACFECYWWRRQAQFGKRRPEAAELLDGFGPVAEPPGGHHGTASALGRIHALVEVRAAIGLEPWAPASLGAVITAQGHPPITRTRPVLRLHDCPGCAGRGRL